MAHDADRTCACMVTHRPHPLELNRHHVWPLAMGGPDTDENVVWVCPTTHANVHELLRLFMRDGQLRSWGYVGHLYNVPVSRYAYDVAAEGYRRVTARSVTP